MIIKSKNNDGSWRELYPKTLGSNVTLNDGRTIEDLKEELDSRVPSMSPLWEGNMYPDGDQVVIPSKKLADCPRGWMLRWEGYNPGSGFSNSNYQYVEIPKLHVLHKNSGAMRFTLGWTGGELVFKYVYVFNDRLEGHSSNIDGNNNRIALSGIFEY